MFLQLLKSLLLWLLPLSVLANHVHWLGDYNSAYQKAHASHKMLLVLVVKKDSPYSNSVLKNIFMNKEYIDTINEKMVTVIVTYEGKASYPVEMYYATVFPALFFVDSNREVFVTEPLYGAAITTKAVTAKIDQLLQK